VECDEAAAGGGDSTVDQHRVEVEEEAETE